MSCHMSLPHFTSCTAFPPRSSRLWGPRPRSSFASVEAPAASSAWTTSRWPPSASSASGPWPRSGELGCRWRRDAPSHMSCFGGFRRISGLKNWEFGPPFLIDTCICNTTNQNIISLNRSDLDWEVALQPCHTFKSNHRIEHHPSKKSFENIRNSFAFICHNCTRPAKCLFSLTQPREPLKIIMSGKLGVTYLQYKLATAVYW